MHLPRFPHLMALMFTLALKLAGSHTDVNVSTQPSASEAPSSHRGCLGEGEGEGEGEGYSCRVTMRVRVRVSARSEHGAEQPSENGGTT